MATFMEHLKRYNDRVMSRRAKAHARYLEQTEQNKKELEKVSLGRMILNFALISWVLAILSAGLMYLYSLMIK